MGLCINIRQAEIGAYVVTLDEGLEYVVLYMESHVEAVCRTNCRYTEVQYARRRLDSIA